MDDDGLPSLVYIYLPVTGIYLKPKAMPTPNLTIYLKVGATKTPILMPHLFVMVIGPARSNLTALTVETLCLE